MFNFIPSVREDNDFDLFDDMFRVPMFADEPLMKTDVTEKDGNYIMKINVPGTDKKDIQISLYNGQLGIEIKNDHTKEEKDEKGTVIRQERFTGSCRRSFYVGKDVKDTDIHAAVRNGVLEITFPKNDVKEIPDESHIDIR